MASESGALERLLSGRWQDERERDVLLREVVGGSWGTDVEALVRMVLQPDEEVRRAAMVRLKRVGTPQMVDVLMREAERAAPEAVSAGVELLSLIAPPGSAQRAALYLGHSAPVVREAAEAFVLAGVLDRELLRVVLGWLGPRSPQERAQRVLEMMVRDLRPHELASPEVFEGLARLLCHADAEVRRDVYRVLSGLGERAPASLWIARMEEEEEEALRGEVLAGLRRSGLGPAPQAGRAVAPLLVSIDPGVRRGALALLLESGDPALAVCAAWQTLSAMPSWLRERALVVLAEESGGWSRGLPVALERAEAAEAAAMLELIAAVGLGGARLQAAIGAWLTDEQLGGAAARTLGAVGDSSALGALTRCLERPGLALAGVEALVALASRLGASGEPEAAQEALALVGGVLARAPEAGLRLAAAAALCARPGPQVWRWLREAAEREGQAEVRQALIECACLVGARLGADPASLAALQGAPTAAAELDTLEGVLAAARAAGARAVDIAAERTPLVLRGERWESLPEGRRLSRQGAMLIVRSGIDDTGAEALAAQGAAVWRVAEGGRGSASVGRGGVDGVFTLPPRVLPTLLELGLEGFGEALEGWGDGLVLVSSPRGGGRTTTLASLIRRVAMARSTQVALIGAPVELAVQPWWSSVVSYEVSAEEGAAAAIAQARRDGASVIAVDVPDGEAVREAALEAALSGALVGVTSAEWRRVRLLRRWFGATPHLMGALRLAICQRLLSAAGAAPVVAAEVYRQPESAPGGLEPAVWLEMAMTGALPEGSQSMRAALRVLTQRGAVETSHAEHELQRWLAAQAGRWREAIHVSR